jgi:hypothetical protein
MLKKTHFLWAAILGLFLTLPAPAFSAGPAPVLMPKLQAAPAQGSGALVQPQMAAQIPPALPSAMRLAAINQLRQQVGAQPASTQPPASVVLTPRNPYVVSANGNNSISMVGRLTVSGSETGEACIRRPTRTPPPDAPLYNDFLQFNVSTIPGKTYLLDLTGIAFPSQTIVCEGAYNGPVQVQQGHILVPFIASYSQSFLLFKRTDNDPGLVVFYKAELIQVN